MRTVINISLPLETKREIAREVKEGGYASVSEFFRAILREHKERTLLAGLLESRREFEAGKGKQLHSLRDLRA
jgi:Arc/MetJ-type ribon-helix-helix transcriptional regulator